MLLARHDHVSHVSRSSRAGRIPTFTWDVQHMTAAPAMVQNADTIVHLAGAGVADQRWTEQRKREILESRTHATRLLYNTLQQHPHHVKTVVAASAIGYYGFEDNDTVFEETDAPGRDFLAGVVKAWEEEIDRIATLGIRVVKIRIGIVLSTKGGALREIAKPVKLYAGSPLGSGQQQVSWVHIDDICGIFIHAIDNTSMHGAYNGVAPRSVTNRELTRAIATQLRKPLFLPPVPGFVLKLLLGEMANLVLNGSRVSSKKIEAAGYVYQYPALGGALASLLSDKHES